MTTTHGEDDRFGSSHDRAERERDLLRELHELTGRPRSSGDRGESAHEARTTEEERRWTSGGSGGSMNGRDER